MNLINKHYKKIKQKKNTTLASLLIRTGLAFVFLYAAIGAFREPSVWIVYVPDFIADAVGAKLALDILSVAQIGLAVWLLTGKYVVLSALASIGFLLGIVVLFPETLYITFRDIGLVGAALALPFLEE